MLFLQHVLDNLKRGGRCAIVLDEGVSFRTDTAFTQTKRKLLNEADMWCILSLPPSTFVNAGAGVKTNIFFFTIGSSTVKVWYYDLSDIEVGNQVSPVTLPVLAAHSDALHLLTGSRKGFPSQPFWGRAAAASQRGPCATSRVSSPTGSGCSSTMTPIGETCGARDFCAIWRTP